jgi:hypothetical protein
MERKSKGDGEPPPRAWRAIPWPPVIIHAFRPVTGAHRDGFFRCHAADTRPLSVAISTHHCQASVYHNISMYMPRLHPLSLDKAGQIRAMHFTNHTKDHPPHSARKASGRSPQARVQTLPSAAKKGPQSQSRQEHFQSQQDELHIHPAVLASVITTIIQDTCLRMLLPFLGSWGCSNVSDLLSLCYDRFQEVL